MVFGTTSGTTVGTAVETDVRSLTMTVMTVGATRGTGRMNVGQDIPVVFFLCPK